MTEGKKTPEDMLEEAKKWIGRERTITFKYPVEYEPIRRYCDMVDDTNPLYLEPEFAQKTKFGNVVLPPFAPFGIVYQGSLDSVTKEGGEEVAVIPPTPGRKFLNLGQEWEWFKPIVVGDRITRKTVLTNVFIKPIRLDPKAFWVTFEYRYSNQMGELACVARNTLILHRNPEEIEKMG